MNQQNEQQLFAEYLASQGIDKGQLPEAHGGTTRNVYDLGGVVAKVAKDPKGIQQNKEEDEDTPNTPKQLTKGKDFVITEKAERSDKEINRWLKPLREYDSKDYEKRNPNLVQLMKNMGIGNFLKYPLLWGDFTAARNWGIDKDGKPTLLDKGTLNDKIYEHDKAPKTVRKEYDKIEQQRRQAKSNVLAARSIQRRKVI